MKLPKPKLPIGKKKPNQSPVGKDSVQAWLPVQDIADGIFFRPDGHPVGVIRVQPAAFNLLSENERARRIATLYEAIQSLPGKVQIAAVPRPIDLDQYIRDLDSRHVEADGARKRLLGSYKTYVRTIVAGAEAMEKRFYVLVLASNADLDELNQRMREFIAYLSRADLNAYVCPYSEILDMHFTFFHSAQAAFERAEGGSY